jgi:hypothetical protein
MIRQLIWFVLGWEGPIPTHSYSGLEYGIAFGGAALGLALYPVFFRLCFGLCQRGKNARVGAWSVAVMCAIAWYMLTLDLFLFNTTLIVFPVLFLSMTGVTFYLFLNRV